MTTGAPKRLKRGVIACLLVLLCSFGLCGCDFGDLFKTTKDKPAAQTEQVAASGSASTQEGEAAEGRAAAESVGAEAAKPSSGGSGSSSGSLSSSESSGGSGSESEPAPESEPEPEPEPQVATISVHVLVDATHAGYGYFFDATLDIPEGSTVYDALVATGLSFGGSSNYVRSINGLAEKDITPQSGWMYAVNGNVPMTPAGAYTLSAGDNLRWYYVTSAQDM